MTDEPKQQSTWLSMCETIKEQSKIIAKQAARIAELETDNTWISVKDKLPERDGQKFYTEPVLVKGLIDSAKYHYEITRYDHDRNLWMCSFVKIVTYWMPIPE